MEIGIGLPNAVPRTTGEELTEWARRAEARGFSSLGTIDRIAYPNLEPLVALSAAAAVTERIRLTTSILIAPDRENATVLAKQAASIQQVSNGRLVLGVAVGGRDDDYEAAGVDFDSRGESFELMLERIRDVWDGSSSSSGATDTSGVGPDVAQDPPELIIGGSIDATFQRAAKYADGWIAGGAPPEAFRTGAEKLDAAWHEAGRDGSPRKLALAYFALGESGAEDADRYLTDYYGWLGDAAQGVVDSAATDPDTVRQYVNAFDEVGCDELIIFPSSSDPDQVDLLADAAGLRAEAGVPAGR